jgi:hypothetical protein
MSVPIVVHDLISDLRRVETWLNSRLGVSSDDTREPQTPDPFSPPDDLTELKMAIDRIRPLLWVYLTRQHEASLLQANNRPNSGVRSLMEDAITISDRYVRKE